MRRINCKGTKAIALLLVAGAFFFAIVARRQTQQRPHGDEGNAQDIFHSKDGYGYIYRKGYFQTSPHERIRQFQNFSLHGRHSDTVLPDCLHPRGIGNTVLDVYKMTEPFKYLKAFKNPCWYDKGNRSKVLCIPYFYFIGTPKAGSSDLFSRICMHPHVTRVRKEQRWFDRLRFREPEKRNISFYIKQYDKGTKDVIKSTTSTGFHQKIIGDGGPAYMFNSNNWYQLPGNEGCLEPKVITLSYIHHLLPSAKLICIVRNPVDRLYSDYLFNSPVTGANKSAEEFHSWASSTVNLYSNCFKQLPFRHCLYSKKLNQKAKVHSFSAGIYSRLLLDVLKLFPRDQLYVVRSEDYLDRNYRKRILDDIFSFLGLDPLQENTLNKIVDAKKRNEGKHYTEAGPMFAKTRMMLEDFYKPFNQELAWILEDQKYLWL